MINHVGKMCVAAMGLCMIASIATRKEEMLDIVLPCDRPITTLLLHCYYKNQWSISQKVVSLRSVVSVNFNQSKAWKSHLR
jgi:hypothetical protein